MTDKQRIPYMSARSIASHLVQLLAPACHRIEVTGSIRRKQAMIGDVEIVCQPRIEHGGLFGDGDASNMLDLLCDRLFALGRLSHRLDKNGRKSYGTKFKRLLFEGFALDLFSVIDPAQWGVIYTIRTGPAVFSHRLVTQQAWGGMMPEGFRVSDGYLWNASGEMVPCLEEGDLFAAIGLPFVAPEDRK